MPEEAAKLSVTFVANMTQLFAEIRSLPTIAQKASQQQVVSVSRTITQGLNAQTNQYATAHKQQLTELQRNTRMIVQSHQDRARLVQRTAQDEQRALLRGAQDQAAKLRKTDADAAKATIRQAQDKAREIARIAADQAKAQTRAAQEGISQEKRILSERIRMEKEAARQIEQEAKRAAQAAGGGSRGRGGRGGISFAGSLLAGAAGGFGSMLASQGVGAVKSLFTSGFELEGTKEQASIGFETQFGKAKAAQLMRQLSAFDQKSSFTYEGAIKAAQEAGGFGFKVDEIMPLLTRTSDRVASLGGGAPQVEQTMKVLGQIRATGKLQAGDSNQLAQQGIPVMEILSKATGKSVQDLIALREKGLIPASVVLRALMDDFKRFEGAGEKAAKTPMIAWDNFQSQLAKTSAVLFKPAIDASTKWLIGFTESLQKGDSGIQKFAKGVQTGFNTVVTWFQKNWPAIQATSKVVFDGVLAAARPVITWFRENWPLIQKTVLVVLTAIVGFWKDHGERIFAIVKGIWQVIATVIGGALKMIGGVLTLGMALITGDWSKAWGAVKTIFSAIVGSIVGVFGGLLKTIGNTLALIIELFTGQKNAFLDSGKSLGQNLVNGILTAIEVAFPMLRLTVDKVRGFFHLGGTAPAASAGAVNNFATAGNVASGAYGDFSRRMNGSGVIGGNGLGFHGNGVIKSNGRNFGNLDDSFASRLKQMIAASGGRITLTDGFRSLQSQIDTKRRKPGLAATPGRSNHGWGMAADLGGDLTLAHQLAPKFGLSFPMMNPGHGKYEPWHVELPGGIRSAASRANGAAGGGMFSGIAGLGAELDAGANMKVAAREAEKARKKAEADAKRAALAIMRAEEQASTGIIKAEKDKYTVRENLLKQRVAHYRKVGMDEHEIDKYYNALHSRILKDRADEENKILAKRAGETAQRLAAQQVTVQKGFRADSIARRRGSLLGGIPMVDDSGYASPLSTATVVDKAGNRETNRKINSAITDSQDLTRRLGEAYADSAARLDHLRTGGDRWNETVARLNIATKNLTEEQRRQVLAIIATDQATEKLAARQNSLRSIGQSVSGLFSSAFEGILTKQKNFAQSFVQGFKSMIIRLVSEWAANKAAQAIIGIFDPAAARGMGDSTLSGFGKRGGAGGVSVPGAAGGAGLLGAVGAIAGIVGGKKGGILGSLGGILGGGGGAPIAGIPAGVTPVFIVGMAGGPGGIGTPPIAGGAGGLGGLAGIGGLFGKGGFGASVGKALPIIGGGLALNNLLGNPLGKVFGGIKKLFHFADGGIPPIGVPSLVGERGPELITPMAPSRVYSNTDTQQMMSGGKAGGQYHLHVGTLNQASDAGQVMDIFAGSVERRMRMSY